MGYKAIENLDFLGKQGSLITKKKQKKKKEEDISMTEFLFKIIPKQ